MLIFFLIRKTHLIVREKTTLFEKSLDYITKVVVFIKRARKILTDRDDQLRLSKHTFQLESISIERERSWAHYHYVNQVLFILFII